MCGICGKYFFDPAKQLEGSLLRRMTSCLERRGPDEEVCWQDKNIGLGVRRLSVIDISLGHQPFCSEDGRLRAVYNGQIYNYRDLRNRLISLGHVFHTDCDGELIPHLYEEHGESFLEHLHGMFSLALVDSVQKKMILARDRMGIKPLYYSFLGNGLIFASSVRAILCDPDVSDSFDPAALHCYFSSNYFPSQFTPFSAIKKLLPGTYIVCEKGKSRIQTYWSLRKAPNPVSPSLNFLSDSLRDLFMRVVEMHLKADVSVGIFLSGGLDSSCIVSSAVDLGVDVAAFSIGFRERSFDERYYASLVARRFGVRHYECMLPQDIGCLLGQIVQSLDIPIGEPSFVPTYELSKFARQHCKVVLSGEGADELFWGYETYLADIMTAPFFCVPLPLRQYVFEQLTHALPTTDTWLNPRQRFDVLLQGLSGSRRRSHYAWREVFTEQERIRLLAPACGMVEKVFSKESYRIFEQYLDDSGQINYLEQANYFDLKAWLSESVLQRVDMASMYHGLEVRVPFLDDSMVEFAYRLPRQQKIRFLQGKFLLKDAFRETIPNEVLYRPKHGFSVSVSAWLKGDLKDFFIDTLNISRGKASSILDLDFIEDLHRQHCSGKRDYGRKLWNVMIFLLWQGQFAREFNIIHKDGL